MGLRSHRRFGILVVESFDLAIVQSPNHDISGSDDATEVSAVGLATLLTLAVMGFLGGPAAVILIAALLLATVEVRRTNRTLLTVGSLPVALKHSFFSAALVSACLASTVSYGAGWIAGWVALSAL